MTHHVGVGTSMFCGRTAQWVLITTRCPSAPVDGRGCLQRGALTVKQLRGSLPCGGHGFSFLWALCPG